MLSQYSVRGVSSRLSVNFRQILVSFCATHRTGLQIGLNHMTAVCVLCDVLKPKWTQLSPPRVSLRKRCCWVRSVFFTVAFCFVLQVSDAFLASLEKLTVMLIEHFPHLHWKLRPSAFFSVLRILIALAPKGATFRGFLSKIGEAHSAYLRSCVYETIVLRNVWFILYETSQEPASVIERECSREMCITAWFLQRIFTHSVTQSQFVSVQCIRA